MIAELDYFTSKIEIKPQLFLSVKYCHFYYFTSKIEIKPQLLWLTEIK